MTTRRNWMTRAGMASVGVALGLQALDEWGAVLEGPAAPGEGSTRAPLRVDRVEGPAPFGLFAPLAVGSSVGNGWTLADLGAVRAGASVMTLAHANGARASVHISLRRGAPVGVAHSSYFDFVLMHDADGDVPTPEGLGVVVKSLAIRARTNEAEISRAGYLAHAQRITQFERETRA